MKPTSYVLGLELERRSMSFLLQRQRHQRMWISLHPNIHLYNPACSQFMALVPTASTLLNHPLLCSILMLVLGVYRSSISCCNGVCILADERAVLTRLPRPWSY